jgi:hypothetical protein
MNKINGALTKKELAVIGAERHLEIIENRLTEVAKDHNTYLIKHFTNLYNNAINELNYFKNDLSIFKVRFNLQ